MGSHLEKLAGTSNASTRTPLMPRLPALTCPFIAAIVTPFKKHGRYDAHDCFIALVSRVAPSRMRYSSTSHNEVARCRIMDRFYNKFSMFGLAKILDSTHRQRIQYRSVDRSL